MKNNSGQGSFLTGFTFGLMAGAVGLFLLTTDEGKKAKKGLEKEWLKTKAKLVKEGVIKDENASVSEIVEQLLQACGKLGAKKTPKQKTKIAKNKTKTSESLKFKGV